MFEPFWGVKGRGGAKNMLNCSLTSVTNQKFFEKFSANGGLCVQETQKPLKISLKLPQIAFKSSSKNVAKQNFHTDVLKRRKIKSHNLGLFMFSSNYRSV